MLLIDESCCVVCEKSMAVEPDTLCMNCYEKQMQADLALYCEQLKDQTEQIRTNLMIDLKNSETSVHNFTPVQMKYRKVLQLTSIVVQNIEKIYSDEKKTLLHNNHT